MGLEERRLQEGMWRQDVTVVRPDTAGLVFHPELHDDHYHQAATSRTRPRAGQIRTEAAGAPALVAKEGTGPGEPVALGHKLQVEIAQAVESPSPPSRLPW
jgi:hypothetical protein